MQPAGKSPKTLSDHLKELDNVTVFPKYVAVDLITRDKIGLRGKDCVGAYALNLESGEVETVPRPLCCARHGRRFKGLSLYQQSGHGVRRWHRHGVACRLPGRKPGNSTSFHPTCLYHPEAKSFLITEALRGEGAKLVLPDGTRFMPDFDERAELAPRDIVARAIDHEMKRLGCDFVYLDISHQDEAFIKSHFPNIYSRCLDLGIDITKEPIPIVPAAHYTCGGIVTGKYGTTDLPYLYAIGESSFTGLHGANRMASNSLLECMVFAHAAAEHIDSHPEASSESLSIPSWDDTQVTNSDEDVIISHNWDELRRFMWDYVGIVRTDKRLQRARRRVQLLQQEVTEYYSNYRISSDLLELRNLILVADLMIQCALRRKESRGLHYTLDYPGLKNKTEDTILTPPSFG